MNDMQEVVDRCRRIETRLTKFIIEQSGEIQSRLPVWGDYAIHLPSVDCSLKQILKVIPKDYTGDVAVYDPAGIRLCYIYVGEA